tara:strand:- start:162 stop:443 length:282 start_codon:yes stop_codon:yes gene_type:complete
MRRSEAETAATYVIERQLTAETAKQTADETKAIFFDLLKQATGEDEKTLNMLETLKLLQALNTLPEIDDKDEDKDKKEDNGQKKKRKRNDDGD